MQALIGLISTLEQLAEAERGARAREPAPRRDDAAATVPVERLAVLERMVGESQQLQRAWFDGLIARGQAPGGAIETTADAAEDHELLTLLRGLQRVVLHHPIAAQAAFSALVAEGREFAATPEGAAWARRLAGSELLRRGRRVWEAASLNLLDPDGGATLPSSYLEALLSAVDHPDVEGLLRRLQRAGEEAGGDDPPAAG